MRRSIEMENLKGVDSIGDNTDIDDKLRTTSHVPKIKIVSSTSTTTNPAREKKHGGKKEIPWRLKSATTNFKLLFICNGWTVVINRWRRLSCILRYACERVGRRKKIVFDSLLLLCCQRPAALRMPGSQHEFECDRLAQKTRRREWNYFARPENVCKTSAERQSGSMLSNSLRMDNFMRSRDTWNFYFRSLPYALLRFDFDVILREIHGRLSNGICFAIFRDEWRKSNSYVRWLWREFQRSHAKMERLNWLNAVESR